MPSACSIRGGGDIRGARREVLKRRCVRFPAMTEQIEVPAVRELGPVLCTSLPKEVALPEISARLSVTKDVEVASVNETESKHLSVVRRSIARHHGAS